MKKFLLIAIVFVFLIATGFYAYLLSIKAQYSGTLKISNLKNQVEIYFDEYAIPHIEAENEYDAYFALGYVQAQERLFQMEMLRRVSQGKLSEILGSEFIKADKLFRTIGIERKAKEMADDALQENSITLAPAQAYLDGVNHFVENGSTPIEFSILGIPKHQYELKDVFCTTGYMAFGFADGFRIDPIISKINSKLGAQYLSDLHVHSYYDSTFIPTQTFDASVDQLIATQNIFNNLIQPLFIGSNAWIVNGSKTSSGKPLFENDTHIGFSQPSVWYEAHITYEDKDFYGIHLAGFPFGIIGHNKYSTWGMTMFENDDIDFFREKQNPNDQTQYWQKDHWQKYSIIYDTIIIKDEKPLPIEIRATGHGPIVTEIIEDIKESEAEPVSMWWAYTNVENDLLLATYELNHSKSIAESRQAASRIGAPGLNIMYADVDNNIAWWAAAKLPIRPNHVDPKLILDGTTGDDDHLGFYSFEMNPKNENPSSGMLYSANNQPDTVNGVLHPGYYRPKYRAKRILTLLDTKEQWSADDFKNMTNDVISISHSQIAAVFANIIENSDLKAEYADWSKVLKNWDGNHNKNSIEPSIYYNLLSWVLYEAMNDELGYEGFKAFAGSEVLLRSYFKLINNDKAIWWDNIHTIEKKESREEIIKQAFIKTKETLHKTMPNTNMKSSEWRHIHQLEHQHPLGKLKPLDKLFNVGPFEVDGGNEVINNMMIKLDTTGIFPVYAGAAVRTVIDLSNMSGAESIIPTGQSGHFLSKHYKDQAQLFVDGKFRYQLMDKEGIEEKEKGVLILTPSN